MRATVIPATAAAVAAVLASSALPASAAQVAAKPKAAVCTALSTVNGSWTGRSKGFTATLRVVNTTATPITGWALALTFKGAGAHVDSLWSGHLAQPAQSPTHVTVTPLAHNTTIQPGKPLVLGFVADGAPVDLKSVSILGNACTLTIGARKVNAGVAAALGAAVEAQAASGQATGQTLVALRHRVAQMKRDETRSNLKAEKAHLAAFVREFHWPAAKTDVTPTATQALLAVADATLASLPR